MPPYGTRFLEDPLAAPQLPSTRVEVFDDRVCELGEGPYYDDRTGRTHWVDILGSRLLWRDATAGGEVSARGEVSTGEHVGAVVPCDDRSVVLCLPAGPVVSTLDGQHVHPLGTYAEADLEAGASLPTAAHPLRSNDAKADPAGRLWLGTMAYDQSPGAGALYRLDPHARLPVRKRGNVTISNGLGWSPDQATMYYVDTPTGLIDAYDYDLATGELGQRRTFAVVEGGSPDGLCVDADGGVWVALWNGSAIRRYRADGGVDRDIAVPTPQVTSCAFTGPALDRLVITTAAQGRPDDPWAGLTYIFDPGDIVGLPVGRFSPARR